MGRLSRVPSGQDSWRSHRVAGSNGRRVDRHGPGLDSVEIHGVLSDEPRTHALAVLQAADEPLSAQALAAEIAMAASGEAEPPPNLQHTVYVSLHQTHLPKLDELDIVEYDRASKLVELQARAAEVAGYMESVPSHGLAWSEYYPGLAVLGLLLVIAGEIGVPVLASVGSLPLATATVLLGLASAT